MPGGQQERRRVVGNKVRPQSMGPDWTLDFLMCEKPLEDLELGADKVRR